EAPVGEVEGALAAVWAELLRVERVGRRDDFFALGGHSLLAVQLIARVRDSLQADLLVRDVFECPTIDGLALRVIEREVLCAGEKAVWEALAELEKLPTTTGGNA
ncbi:MAG: phosphopantetheine-binding protein, partial [Luteibacter jiangsuensis]